MSYSVQALFAGVVLMSSQQVPVAHLYNMQSPSCATHGRVLAAGAVQLLDISQTSRTNHCQTVSNISEKSVVQLLLEKCRRFQLLLEKCRCFQLCCKSVAVFNYGGQSVVSIDQSLQLSLPHHHLLLLVRASIYHLGLLLLLPLQHLLTIAHLQCCSCQVLLLHQHLLQCL